MLETEVHLNFCFLCSVMIELLFPVQIGEGGCYMNIAVQPQISLASLLSMITFSTSLPADQQPHAIISALVGDSLHDLPANAWVRANQPSARTSHLLNN